MTEYRVGQSSKDYLEAARLANAASGSIEELNRKEAQRRASEESTATTEAQSARTRTGLAGATNELSAALRDSMGALQAETSELTLNSTALARNLELRRAIAGTPLTAGGGFRGGGGGGSRPVAYAGDYEEDPNAAARLEQARRAQAQADARAAQATRAYTAAVRPTSGVPVEDQAALLAQRDAAREQARVARQETGAAQASVAANQQIAQAREAQLQEVRQTTAALSAERRAAEQAAAETRAAATERASLAVSGVAPLQLGSGRSGREPIGLLGPGRQFNLGPVPTEQSGPRQPIYAPGGEGWYGVTAGGPASATRLSAGGDTEEMEAYRVRAAQNTQTIAGLGEAQRRTNRSFAEAGAVYADSSQALSRHGALTTEFIQAFARGQVTLGEFSTQMVSTIGKFGGWAIAGAAVYGVFDAFKHLTEGATQTQAAVQQLGRFIPGLGGPAGGGNSQIPAAEATVRDISTQFNVPIKDVVDSMSVMARTFHSVASAGDATRAVLAVQRLDQVPAAQAELYLGGISRSLNLKQGSEVVGVVNSLNALQSEFGARVSQTLPALARAAPAARAGGLDAPTLEALVALGVRSGIPGNQVGTALLRSIGTFAFRPQSQLTFREYGIEPQQGQYGTLIRDVSGLIDRRQAEGRPLQGTDLRNLAQALGGPLLGSRTLLPLLEQEQANPGTLAAGVRIARHPRPYQEDLDQVLGQVSERFKSIGIALENFGSRLASAGLLSPITAVLDTFTTLVHVTERLISPLTEAASLFNQLPSAVRDVIGALLAFRAARALYGTSFGSGALNAIGALPTHAAEERDIVEGTQARLQNFLIPRARQRAESAAGGLLDVNDQIKAAQADLAKYQAANAALAYRPTGDPEGERYQAGVEERQKRIDRLTSQGGPRDQAEQRVAETSATLAEQEADLKALKNKQFTYAERAVLAEQQGYVALEAASTLIDEMNAARTEQLQLIRSQGARLGSGLATGPAATEAEAAAGAAGAAAAAAATARRTPPVPPVAPPREPPPVPVESEAARSASLRTQLGALAATATGLGPLYPRLQGLGEEGGLRSAAQSARESVGRFLGGGGLPIAGLIGSQLIGAALPGDAGNYITNVGGTAFGAAMIASLLKPGSSRAAGAGLGAGLLLGGYQTGGTLGGLTGAVGGGLLARSALSAAAELLPLDTVAPEIGVPLTIAATLGGFLLGKSGGSPQDQQQKAQQDALRAIGLGTQAGSAGRATNLPDDLFKSLSGKEQAEAIAAYRLQQPDGGRDAAAQIAARHALAHGGDASAITKFGDKFAEDLDTAFAGSGEAASKAQAKIQSEVQNLTAELQLFGAGSPQGRAATARLQQVISSAIDQSRTDPSAAKQLLDSALQPQQQAIQEHFKYALAVGGPDSAAQSVTDANAQLQATLAPIGAAVNSKQQDYASALDAYHAAQQSGNRTRIASAKKDLDSAQQALGAAQSLYQLQSESTTLAQQALAQQGFQITTQGAQARGSLAQALVGGDVTRQLRVQAASQREQLGIAESFPGLDTASRQTAIYNAQAQLADTHTKLVQQGLTELQSRGTLAEARVPLGDPVGDAQTKLKDLLHQYAYVTANANAFDPKDIRDLAASVITAKKEVAQAASTYAITMNDINGQIAEAKAVGDKVRQAQIQVQVAEADLAAAVTPEQRAQAHSQIIQAQNAQYEAITSRADNAYQISETYATGDSAAQARIAQAKGQYDLSRARGPDEAQAAQLELAQAAVQAHQSALAVIGAQTQLNEARDSGDNVAVAQAAIDGARRELAAAHGIDEITNAERDLATANAQYRQALEQRYEAIGQLQSSRDVGNSVKQAADNIKGTLAALAVARSQGAGQDELRGLNQRLQDEQNQYYAAVTSRQDARFALFEAEAPGNSLQQGRLALAQGRYDLRRARGPEERLGARREIAQADAQLRQARSARIDSLGQLEEARAQGDPVREAQITLRVAEQELANAHGIDQIRAAETKVAQAQVQLHQAYEARIQSLGQLHEAQAGGDSLAVAQIAVQVAQRELAAARGEQEKIAALTALAQADQQLHQAYQDRITALGALAASTTREPLEQLSAEIAAAEEVLAHAVTEQEKIAAQTNLNNLKNEYEAAVIAQTEDTINFQLQMKQITAQQAIQQLKALESTQHLTTQERQQVDEQIRQLQLGNGNSEFNLAPGKIKLPTIYDVVRAMHGVAPIGAAAVVANSSTQVNVYVRSSADVPAVADAIDRATGSQLKAQLRAAGMS